MSLSQSIIPDSEEETPSEVKRIWMAGVAYGANLCAARTAEALKNLAVQYQNQGFKPQEAAARLSALHDMTYCVPDDDKLVAETNETFDRVKKQMDSQNKVESV